MENVNIEFKPFQNIALAFSGGGFRAAAFALGTLSYLEHLKIAYLPSTKKVTYIGSTSGGTIANLLYSSAIHQGVSFSDFYLKTKSILEGEQLLKNVLELLIDDKKWNKVGDEKRRNLINAFARVYDSTMFGGLTMDVFSDKTFVKKFEICCNATEFYRGLTFRFKTNGTKVHKQFIGNLYLHFDDTKIQTFRKLKLGDVLAASSCFPMGFEPIVFPEDFTYNDDKAGSLSSDELRDAVVIRDYNEIEHKISDSPNRSFGLMDGGITDNQGLKSLMLADERRRRMKKPDPFDLMIITDVTSYFMDYYKVPETKSAEGWRTRSFNFYRSLVKRYLRFPKRLQNVSLWLALASLLLAVFVPSPPFRLPALVLFGAGMAVFLAFKLLRSWAPVRELLSSHKEFDPFLQVRDLIPPNSLSDHIIETLMSYIGRTRLNILEQIFKARISSVISMVMDVNLKHVRRLIYEMFYGDTRWNDRRVPNFIYELSTYNKASRINRINDSKRLRWKATEEDKILLTHGLEKLEQIAEKARTMGTTLWFDETDQSEDQLANIIKTGQFTTCMNLLEYVISLERKKVEFNRSYTLMLTSVKKQLIADINRFKAEPGFLY